jgi:hypothetical protein
VGQAFSLSATQAAIVKELAGQDTRVKSGSTSHLCDPQLRIQSRGAALTSRLQSFETEMLAEEENFAGLAGINRELVGRVEAVDSPQWVVLDMDSTEIPVYGQQEKFDQARPLRAAAGGRETGCWQSGSAAGV